MSEKSYLMIVNVMVAICDGPKYLVIRRGPGVSHLPGILDIPGGKAEFHETADWLLEETARREIKEEVGLELGPELVYLTSAGFTVPAGTQVANIVFLAPYPGGIPSISQPEEVAAISWQSYEELMASPAIKPWTRSYLQFAEVQRQLLGW